MGLVMPFSALSTAGLVRCVVLPASKVPKRESGPNVMAIGLGERNVGFFLFACWFLSLYCSCFFSSFSKQLRARNIIFFLISEIQQEMEHLRKTPDIMSFVINVDNIAVTVVGNLGLWVQG